MQVLRDYFTHIWFTEQVIHHILTFVDLPYILQREKHPATQHSSPHRGDGLVYDIKQRDAVLVHGSQQLQVPDRELIQTDIAVLFYST